MSKSKDLEILRDQEATLLLLHRILNDQLNRLKVEELALTSSLCDLKQREMNEQICDTMEVDHIAAPNMEQAVLNLAVGDSACWDEEENEEELHGEEEEQKSMSADAQLQSFLQDLFQKQKHDMQSHCQPQRH